MRKDIHPNYDIANIECACGNNFETRSTRTGTIKVDLCSGCHPFYTGRQKLVDTEGRVERFRKKYEKVLNKKA